MPPSLKNTKYHVTKGYQKQLNPEHDDKLIRGPGPALYF
jgi:hypothetical protein